MGVVLDLLKKSAVRWGLALAALGGVIAYILQVNDFTRPPVPDPKRPQDFGKDLDRLDPSRPIGLFVFNVLHKDFTRYGVNASRNNFIKEMREHYGDNMMVIDNPTMAHLRQFSEQFNARFGRARPQVHVVANHHQGTYDDRQFADFLASIEGTHKRALVIACGPVSGAYEKAGCDYVMIPAPDGLGNTPEPSLEISVGYRKAIGWLATIADPEEARRKFGEPTLYNLSHEAMEHLGAWSNRLTNGHCSHDYKPPVVVTPATIRPPFGGQGR